MSPVAMSVSSTESVMSINGPFLKDNYDDLKCFYMLIWSAGILLGEFYFMFQADAS